MTSLHNFIVVDLVRCPAIAASSACPDAPYVGLRVLRLHLFQDTVLRCESCILVLWESEAQGYRKVVAQPDLGHPLAFKLSDSLRGLSRSEIPMAKLAHIVGAPGVAGACARDHACKAGPRDLEVMYIELLGALDAMRRVELAEGTLAPDAEKVASN